MASERVSFLASHGVTIRGSVANLYVIQDLRCIQYGIQPAVTVCRIQCIQASLEALNPIRKDVPANLPNWLFEGVVATAVG